MTNTKRTTITCKNINGKLEFFACSGGKSMYLFSQRYNKAVFARFCKGVELGDALTPKRRCGRNLPLEKVSDKLPVYIRDLEQEYDVSILNNHRAAAYRRFHRSKKEKEEMRYAA